MGLKTTNYSVRDYGIILPQAYARVSSIFVDIDGVVTATFEIQQSREDIGLKNSFNKIYFECEIDKDQPLYKQVYEKAKDELFSDWKDDII